MDESMTDRCRLGRGALLQSVKGVRKSRRMVPQI
jgi:hypothetical protein